MTNWINYLNPNKIAPRNGREAVYYEIKMARKREISSAVEEIQRILNNMILPKTYYSNRTGQSHLNLKQMNTENPLMSQARLEIYHATNQPVKNQNNTYGSQYA